MPRVEQITDKAQIPAEWYPLYDRIAAARGRVAGPYSILLHAPAVADRVDQLSQVLRSDTEVDAQGFVLAALAVARAKDCLFVWSVQAPNARRAGLADDAIAAIRNRQTTGLTDDQKDIISYCQQLASANRVDAATFDRLKARHGARWLVELTTIAGHFGLICGVNNAFEVPPSPQGDQL
ncbi:MAG: carboxymuconolactone decarboxylase family protein [Chloroflexi bacterium]|nr:carboxymuconolactone decarboxylase family protein [Chloroflexota bacterium]MBV9600583.1 carboxymuconolactone decarboxylase family protein [Chloroflexota bacterium]